MPTEENEFAPNNVRSRAVPDKATPEPKKVNKVVTGKVVQRKTPLGKRFKNLFISGDSQSVMSFILMDVMVPAAKDTIADVFTQGIERMMYGDARSTSRRTGGRPGAQRINYGRVTTSSNPFNPAGAATRSNERGVVSHRARSTHDFGEFVLATRVEAEEVLARLEGLIDDYKNATVDDLYDMLGLTSEYTDGKWGWYDLQYANVVRVRDGYVLDLPRPEPIGRS